MTPGPSRSAVPPCGQRANDTLRLSARCSARSSQLRTRSALLPATAPTIAAVATVARMASASGASRRTAAKAVRRSHHRKARSPPAPIRSGCRACQRRSSRHCRPGRSHDPGHGRSASSGLLRAEQRRRQQGEAGARKHMSREKRASHSSSAMEWAVDGNWRPATGEAIGIPPEAGSELPPTRDVLPDALASTTWVPRRRRWEGAP
jgi:hypothetical protein